MLFFITRLYVSFSYMEKTILLKYLKIQLHGKNDFIEGSKILLNTDLKIMLLAHQNNFVKISKVMSNAARNISIPAIGLSILHNYFDSLTKLLF